MQNPTTDSPAEALALAIAAAQGAEHCQAERHALHAASLAEREGNAAMVCQARTIAGRTWIERGDPRRAVRLFRRSLDAVETVRGAGELRAKAYHDLATGYVLASQGQTARAFYGKAANAYGPNHRWQPVLRGDIAFVLLMQGRYAEAAAELAPLLDADTPPSVTLRHQAHYALAVAGSGRPSAGAVQRLEDALQAAPETETAWGWVCYAQAARMTNARPEAIREAADRALRIARRHAEAYTMAAAIRLLTGR